MGAERTADELASDLGLPPREGPATEPDQPFWILNAPMNARRFAFLLLVPVVVYLVLTVDLSRRGPLDPRRASIDVWRSAVAVVGAALWAFLLQARFRYLRCVESLCTDIVRLGQSAVRVGGSRPPGPAWRDEALRDAWNISSDWSGIVCRYRFFGIDYPEAEAEEVQRLILALFKSLVDGRMDLGPDERLQLASAIRSVAEATSRGDKVRRRKARGANDRPGGVPRAPDAAGS